MNAAILISMWICAGVLFLFVLVAVYLIDEMRCGMSMVLAEVYKLSERGKEMDTDIQALIDEVKANETVEESAVAAINGLADRLLAALDNAPLTQSDRDTLKALVQEQKDHAAALSAAIAAAPAAPTSTAAPAPASAPATTDTTAAATDSSAAAPTA